MHSDVKKRFLSVITFVYTNMATVTQMYLESQRKYTELQVVYTESATGCPLFLVML